MIKVDKRRFLFLFNCIIRIVLILFVYPFQERLEKENSLMFNRQCGWYSGISFPSISSFQIFTFLVLPIHVLVSVLGLSVFVLVVMQDCSLNTHSSSLSEVLLLL